MLSVIRAEIGRSRRRRAVWLIALITLGTLGIYSWSNHSNVANLREFLRRDEAYRLQTGQLSDGYVRDFIDSTNQTIERRRVQLSAGQSHHFLLGFFGTAMGVAISVVLASTMVGADFRWGYWKTLAAHEPRRWRLLAAKFMVLWLFILLGLLVVLALSYPLNSLFGQLYDVRSFGGIPRVTSILNELGRAWLVNCAYGSLAAAIVLITRSNLAGLGGGLGLTLADGFLSQKFPFLGYASPAQQVSALLPPPDPFTSFNDVLGVQWFEAVESQAFVVVRVGGKVTMKAISPLAIPDERAALILTAWVLLALVVAILAMRSRDLPA